MDTRLTLHDAHDSSVKKILLPTLRRHLWNPLPRALWIRLTSMVTYGVSGG